MGRLLQSTPLKSISAEKGPLAVGGRGPGGPFPGRRAAVYRPPIARGSLLQAELRYVSSIRSLGSRGPCGLAQSSRVAGSPAFEPAAPRFG